MTETEALNDGAEKTALDDDRVVQFLRRRPDFLARHSDLLSEMLPPGRWSGNSVVDIQQVMVERLRGEIDHMRACANELIVTSRSNLSVQTRTHAAVLAMLGAGSVEHLFRVVTEDLPLLLDVDVVSLCFEPGAVRVPDLLSPDIRQLQPGDVESVMGDDTDVLLTNDLGDDGSLFGPAAVLVRSAALCRVRPGLRMPPGLLAMGARSHATFHPDQGTELALFLVRVLERVLYRWIEPSGAP